MKTFGLIFIANALVAVPALAGEHEVARGPTVGYSVSGPHRLSTACHVQYYRIDGDKTLYRRTHCPGAPNLDSIGMPVCKPPINMHGIRESHIERARVYTDKHGHRMIELR